MALSLNDVIKTKKIKKEEKQKEVGENNFRKKFAPFQVDPSLEITEKQNIAEEDSNEMFSQKISQQEAEEMKTGSERKRGANGVQTNLSMLDRSAEKGASEVQTECKRGANGVQTNLSMLDRSAEKGASEVQTECKRGANGAQTSDPSILVGREKQLLEFLVLECQRIGSLQTEPLTIERLKDALNHSTNTIKSSIKRLIIKGQLSRGFRKNGRSGWVQYQVPQSIYEKVLYSKTVLERSANEVQTERKRGAEKGAEKGADAPNSSSILKIKNTTTEKSFEIRIPENLKSTFSQKELFSIVEKGLLSEELLQQSLEHFAFDLENNAVRAKTNPINLFFGLARSGKVYRSLKMLQDETEAIKAYELEYNKALSANILAKERQNKSQEEENFARDLSESSEDFKKWFSSTTKDEHLTLVRASDFCPYGGELYLTVLKAAFVENVYKKQK